MDYIQIGYHEKIKRKNDGKSMEECVFIIHKEYIAKIGWRDSLWKGVMGKISGYGSSTTLVDVVNSIWNTVSTLVNKIKAAAEEFAAGVKAGLEYISNAVLTAIYTSISTMINGLLITIFKLFETIAPDFVTIISTSPLLWVCHDKF